MVKSEVGEDEVVFCSGCDYAANMEKAVLSRRSSKEEMKELKEVDTPNVKTIDELEDSLIYQLKSLLKLYICKLMEKLLLYL